MMTAAPLTLLFGGSFNPPHVAHLRLAIEAAEALRPDAVVFIPTAQPPHKIGGCLLPFELRLALLQAALDELPAGHLFSVSEIENQRPGPSYTVETLQALAARHPTSRLVFAMGSEDYSRIQTWLRWKELPLYADLLILPRSAWSAERFAQTTRSLWPEARPLPQSGPDGSSTFALPGAGRLLYLPQPILEISSTLIRERFLAGRRLEYLVPSAVERLLQDNQGLVQATWGVRACAPHSLAAPGLCPETPDPKAL